MRYLSLVLKGYKPLSYGGIEELTVDDFDQINVLTGENGKGKSSVLRELTPYPASRADYHKDGYKKIEISHKGKHYTLVSDFSKNPVHSFRVNDIEQNVSGTGEVQEDLVEQHFEGYSRLIEKLVSGGCKFSMMSKNERKQLFMSTYPSNLEFVLNKHKNLMSMIRAGNSQMKLLKERVLKLKESFVSDDVLEFHQENMKLMNEALLALDKDIYAFEMTIKPYVENIEKIGELPYTLDDLKMEALNISKKFQELIHTGYATNNETDLQWFMVSMEGKINQLNEHIKYLKDNGLNWLQEVEKYKDALSVDSEDLLKQYRLERSVQLDIIRKYPYRDDLSVMDEESISWWREHENQLDLLQAITSSIGPLWTSAEYQNNLNRLHQIDYQMSEMKRSQDRLIESAKALKIRISKYEANGYPSDCLRTCRLRESVQQILASLKEEYTKTVTDIDNLCKLYSNLDKEKSGLETDLSCRTTSLEIIQDFSSYFLNNSWKDFALNHKTLIDILNTDITGLVNRMHLLINYSWGQMEVKKAKDALSIVEARIEILQNEHLPSKKKMEELVTSLEEKLKTVESDLLEKQQFRKELTVQYEFCKKHDQLIGEIQTLCDNFETLKTQMTQMAAVEFVRNEIEHMRDSKILISGKLRDCEVIVKEQENLRLRLNEEVLPTLDKVSKDVYKWGFVEKELSPVTGLPKRIMTRYINGIFQRANRFISQVWNYEMELVYLKEEDDCDYTFPVLINNDGTVKDISICSKGQKEIIDLALILAICMYRGYTLEFPLKLDEMSSGLSPDHNSKLFGFLGDLFSRDEILQAFIVSHDPIVNNGFDQAGYVALSESGVPDLCRVISKIK